MRKTLLFCLFLGYDQCLAQEQSLFKTHNSIYLEVLGSGGLYSLNYEHLFSIKTKQAYGFRAGTSFYNHDPGTVNVMGELFTVVGRGKHHGDFGLGFNGTYGRNTEGPYLSSKRVYLNAVPRLSYRYQKPTGGLMVRAGFTPFIKLAGNDDTRAFNPWLGLAIGHSF